MTILHNIYKSIFMKEIFGIKKKQPSEDGRPHSRLDQKRPQIRIMRKGEKV